MPEMILLTTWDLAKADGATWVDPDQIPAPPRIEQDGVVDEANQRWRFKDGKIVTYIRYGGDSDTWVDAQGRPARRMIAVYDAKAAREMSDA